MEIDDLPDLPPPPGRQIVFEFLFHYVLVRMQPEFGLRLPLLSVHMHRLLPLVGGEVTPPPLNQHHCRHGNRDQYSTYMDWHALHEGEEPKLLELAERYKLHPLHIEDCQHRDQSAKIEDGDTYLFAVFKPVFTEADGTVAYGDFDVFIGPNYLITYEETGCEKLLALVEKYRKHPNLTNDQIFYRILDGIVDSYVPILDTYGDQIDTIEDQVLSDPKPDLLERIFALKRAFIELRRVLNQTRDLTGHVMRSEHTLIAPKLNPYFRDIYDHLSRHIETVEMSRDLLSGALDIYLSSIANRTNQTMKILTLLSTIALPSVAMSSFFGMNFERMPWIHSPNGLLYAAAASLTITVLLIALLKIRGWL
jgi:magnesium transporter